MKEANSTDGVTLKNGTIEDRGLVIATMMSIRGLMGSSGLEGLLLVADLVSICRKDPTYQPYGDNEKKLKELSLINSDGSVHESIRNIVLSAANGEGLEMSITSPLAT